MLTHRSRTGTRDPAADEWSSPVGSGLALAGFLVLVFAGFTLLAMGPLMRIDAYFNLDPAPPAWRPVLHVLDRIGQRAVALPILGVALYRIWRRHRSWRPLVTAGAAVFMLNLVVLILKLSFGRGEPVTGDPGFFNGGMAYPSGHSSNIVLVYGLIPFLLRRYRLIGRREAGVLWTGVALLSVVMVGTSLTLDWHWFADLVAGLLVGGLVLQLTEVTDRLVPDPALPRGWRPVLRDLAHQLRRRPHDDGAPVRR